MTDTGAPAPPHPSPVPRAVGGLWRSPVLRRFVTAPSAILGLTLVLGVVAVALLAPVVAGDPAYDAGNVSLAPPSRDHPFGTDHFQRDVLTLVVHGIRQSMSVVGAVVAMSSVIGIGLGVVAGYRGGLVDDAIVRVAELLQSVPRFFLAYLVVGLYGPGLSKIILVLGLTSWTFLARVVRAETLSLKRRPYIEAARASGASARRIILTHVIPNVLPQAVVIIVLMGSRVILIEAGLAYLGLGNALEPSLGTLARNAQDFLRDQWWMSVYPGAAIVAAVLGMNLLSDGLNSALNPQGSTRAPRVREALAT